MLDDVLRLGLALRPPAVHPLPTHRHLPGTGSSPDLAPLDAIKSSCCSPITTGRWQDDLPYRYGWLLFAHEYFWETHEVWEVVWKSAPVNSRERFLLQCLIQLANARLKRQLGRPKAADKLLAQCRSLAHSAFPPDAEQCEAQLLGLDSRNLKQLIGRAE